MRIDGPHQVGEWCRYDEGDKGFLDARDLRAVLRALGMLDGVPDRDHFVAAQLALASGSGARRLTCDEFCAYYASLQFAGAPLLRRVECGVHCMCLHVPFCAPDSSLAAQHRA